MTTVYFNYHHNYDNYIVITVSIYDTQDQFIAQYSNAPHQSRELIHSHEDKFVFPMNPEDVVKMFEDSGYISVME